MRLSQYTLPALAAALALTGSALAQMKTGEQMKNYEEVFGVKINQRTYPYEVTLLEGTPEGNVLYPGEQPRLKLLFTNKTDAPIKTEAKMEVIPFGTRGIPGDIWLPELVRQGDPMPGKVALDIPANGSQIVEFAPKIPEKFGAYAIVADLGPIGRRLATSCARTFAASPERIQYPTLSLDDAAGVPILKRLGIQAIRMEFGYVPTTQKDYEKKMALLDQRLKEYQENNITVLLVFNNGGGNETQALGRTRPHLDADGVMLDTKQDYAWLPQYDADFQKFVADTCRKYGWPKGPVTAVELWNEPWEGISISGWGADSERFREIFTAMARGVEEARKDGADVLIAGCDSSTNTFDKLFADGSDTFLKWLDVCAIHYQGPSTPSIYRKWIDRDSPRGRVKIWDTESWVANTDDRVAAVIAANRAFGYDRAMGVYFGNVSREIKKEVELPDKTRQKLHNFDAWSTAAAVGAANHFLGERPFRELLFKNGLPWVMVFDGLKGQPDDGTIVVVGDMGESFEPDLMLFRQVEGLSTSRERKEIEAKLAALPAQSPEREALEKQLQSRPPLQGATLTLKNPDGEFVLADFYGNPVSGKGGQITVPLDGRGFFLRTNGKPGSFERLTKAVAQARIDGYEPVDIVAHDMLTPVDRESTLRLTLTNILNRPVQGTLKASLGDLTLDLPKEVSLQAHETREIKIPVKGGTPRPDNTYPLSVEFDAGKDGSAAHRESLHVNQIARRTIAVDGNLEDWKGALPQPVTADEDGPTVMEAAWLPFVKYDTGKSSGTASGFLGYDDKAFYFAAKILDTTPSDGTLRFAKRDLDADFYPEVSYEYDGERTFLKKDETWNQPIREAAALQMPGAPDQRSHTAWSSIAKALAVDLSVEKPTTVTFYFVDWDGHKNGRRNVLLDLQDPETGKSLARTTVAEYGPGNHVSFLVSGKVRAIIRTRSWLGASLSGIFLDPAPQGVTLNGSPAAKLLGTDLNTAGNWIGKYGRDGFVVAGAEPRLPDGSSVRFLDDAPRVEHRWPEGVRRYSYRQRPALPFGSAPKFDNVQIAFNVIPVGEKASSISHPPGTMPRFIPYEDTDYEYALNPVAGKYGGGTEIWRSLVPGMVRKHFYPRQPAAPQEGAVEDGQLAIKHEGNTRIIEAAIPWSEIPLVKKALDEGKTVRFSFRVNDNGGPGMELAAGRSVSKKNPMSFHPDWIAHWANEVEFSFEK
ncbi:hypothetical protein TSACC_2955 [Terrimicrobium sacchariphilum]|uniref:Uncharacterized protein n=1 Tax=Terrimicrobium sacchariphilum TaxID=690879 RepID=A0A146G7A4_TERSA|nr:hypothetical protein [Terrimicrobium sacchariphilum]GAT32556.1 hypothetical protein TSACC_2955 [Terrimicrobium sacchariphilum]